MTVQSRRQFRQHRRVAEREGPHVERVRADTLAAGNTIEHEGRLLHVARIEARGRIEVLAHPPGAPAQTQLFKLRGATQVRRCSPAGAAA